MVGPADENGGCVEQAVKPSNPQDRNQGTKQESVKVISRHATQVGEERRTRTSEFWLVEQAVLVDEFMICWIV